MLLGLIGIHKLATVYLYIHCMHTYIYVRVYQKEFYIYVYFYDCLHKMYYNMFFHSTCSSVCPSWIGCGERERSTLGNGWLGYSPRSREEWHHHFLYCSAARHTWCCCPEWDSCSARPNLWLTSVTCSQLHQFEATHQLLVESCSHNHCWGWSIFISFSFPYTGVEWVVGSVT